MTPTQAAALDRHKKFHADIAAKAARVGVEPKGAESMPAQAVPPRGITLAASGSFATPYEAPIGAPINWNVSYTFGAKPPQTLEASMPRYSIEAIKRTVAGYYGLTHAQLISPRRFQGIVRARMVTAYLADKLIPISYSEIARRLGGRDHTTIMSAIKRLEPLCRQNAGFAADVAEIIELVTGQAG